MKVFLASFSRASNGAISLLAERLAKENMLTYDLEEAKYVVAVGDRWETYSFVFDCWKANKHIVHLWAGECTPGCDDEIHRHAMTLMSDMQLCTNEHAKKRVERLCKVGGKIPNATVVGNVMMENLPLDDSILKEGELTNKGYDLILYNPHREHILEDLAQIKKTLLDIETLNFKGDSAEGFKTPFIWIRPNTDRGYEYVMAQAKMSPSQPRPKFLSLIKHCRYFITNSSCAYYEAPFLIKKRQIIQIGLRNAERESKYAKMDIPNASNNIIKALKALEASEARRREAF